MAVRTGRYFEDKYGKRWYELSDGNADVPYKDHYRSSVVSFMRLLGNDKIKLDKKTRFQWL